MKLYSYAVLVLGLIAGSLVAAEPVLVPFPMDWQSSADSPASAAFLLERPAGKDGFVRAAGGHLVKASGGRLRIWGVNITGRATTPSKKTAPLLADHLARCGINCVRLHFLDRPAPQGLIDAKRNDTRALDPSQLDRLDFFIAQLRERGIYTDLNLNVGRTYKAGDGVRDYELLGFAKALTYFDPHLLELQREYARQLLTHRNAYTGNEYRTEPAVALVEMVNENSIVESWFSGRLLGKATRRNPGTWTDIPASYEKDLTELYNRWLREYLSPEALGRLRAACGISGEAPIPRLRPNEFAAAPKERFHTEASFYMDLERRYFDDMGRFLREELGVKPLLLGTSDHNHGRSGYPLVASTSRLDVVDGHVYWQHPNYVTDPATGRQKSFNIPNTPMVNDPLHSTVVQLSRSAVAGKPYIVSEVNHPFPAECACEGIPILTAYAALHDWDGIFWYTLAHEPLLGAKPRAIGRFDLGLDPMKMTQIAACAVPFLRGDVRPAARTVTRSYSAEQVRESLRLPWSEGPYYTPGFPLSLPLLHATRISSLEESAGRTDFQSVPQPPRTDLKSVPQLASDTGELTWRGAAEKHGVVTVDTAKSQAIVGFSKDAPGPSGTDWKSVLQTANLSLRIDNPFAAVTLTTLDGLPIARSMKLLLTTTARVANSDMEWSANRKTLESWGHPPPCIEPVTGTVLLRNLEGTSEVTAQPLDSAGRPLGPAVSATKTTDGWTVPLGNMPTTWYLIAVRR